jgi:FdrA protein
MAVSRAAQRLDGVTAAVVAMATDLNRDLLADLGFELPADATPDDLVVAVEAADAGRLAAALQAVEEALGARRATSTGGLGTPSAPRTVAAAARRADADIALVSVPGEHAYVEAVDALRSGLHVMVFSDNVPLDQERALKDEAARRGLLVLGPDAGTTIVSGVGLGFANAVKPGPVGMVGASGTGIQQLCCLLDAAGVGVSHALGVGGRDLSAEIGGASTLAALRALDADPATELIVVVSKPPAPAVAERVTAAAAGLATPVVTAFLGPGRPDLTAVVTEVLAALGREGFEPPAWPAERSGAAANGRLAGLFAGGTLCEEARTIAAAGLDADRYTFVDYGDDRYTRGRPHPMIDDTLRLEAIAREAADPPAVLLLDVVLGHGASADPSAQLAPALAGAVGAGLAAVVSLCGTASDVQGLHRQAEAFTAAGVSVHLSNAAAAREAVALVVGT